MLTTSWWKNKLLSSVHVCSRLWNFTSEVKITLSIFQNGIKLVGDHPFNTLTFFRGEHTASFWDITIQWTSHDDLTEKYFSHFTVNRNERTCQMTEIQNCTLWFDKKTASIEFCQLQINLEAKSMHGSSWKKDSIISKFALFFAGQVLFTVNGLL